MEWLVPVLFVLASIVQWWMQRNRQEQDKELPEPPPAKDHPASSPLPRRETDPREEFGDLGDLLEALGRRRHESPPQPVKQSQPPVLPAPVTKSAALPKPVRVPMPTLEPVIIHAPTKTSPSPVVTGFPGTKSSPISDAVIGFSEPESLRATFRPFPAATKPDVADSHRWAAKLKTPETARDVIVLSEILAPPLSLR